jgi:hypothetical protein
MPRWGNGSALPFTCCPFCATLKPVDMYPPHSTRAHASGRKSLSTGPEHVRCLAAPLAARPRLAVSLHVSHLRKSPNPQARALACLFLSFRHPSCPDGRWFASHVSVGIRHSNCSHPHTPPPSALQRTFAFSLGTSSPSPVDRITLRFPRRTAAPLCPRRWSTHTPLSSSTGEGSGVRGPPGCNSL